MASQPKMFSSSTPNWEEFYDQQKSEMLEDDQIPEYDDFDDHDDE